MALVIVLIVIVMFAIIITIVIDAELMLIFGMLKLQLKVDC